MINPTQLEDAYKEFSENLGKWLPDGVLSVNLSLLNELGLLDNAHFGQSELEDLSPLFHVTETNEKVTLYNEQFAIWIVPKLVENIPSTFTFISLLHQSKPHLEIVFSTTGVYNSPRYILKVLQHFLTEVTDTEAIITAMDKKQSS